MISCAFSPVMNKTLHAMFVKICTSRGDHCATAETHHPPPHCAHIHCLVDINVQQASMNISGVSQRHPFASYTLPCQMPFHQTAPLLPSVTRQQNEMEHMWEGSTSTAIPPTLASEIVSQCNEIGGITFRAALVFMYTYNAKYR